MCFILALGGIRQREISGTGGSQDGGAGAGRAARCSRRVLLLESLV